MIDIQSKKEGPAGKLSNFTRRLFFFDGVPCASLEGPIQAFKFEDPEVQKEICMLSGREAKIRGQEGNEIFQSTQTLWWLGEKFSRGSNIYQWRLDKLYETVSQLKEFQVDLLSTGNEILVHSIGEQDPRKTVMTEEEFCSRLMKNRGILRKELMAWTIKDLNKAASMIEKDGCEAFCKVTELYGEKVATILVTMHLRRSFGSMDSYPPDPKIDEQVISILKWLIG